MKKNLLMAACTAAMSLTLCFPAFAGGWQSDANGWWWQNNDGSYPANTWQWIDGNNDGTAESYCFDSHGYCLMNTTTPDGYQVDGNGAWIVNNVIQTRNITGNASANPSDQQEKNTEAIDLLTLEPVDKRFYNEFSNKKTNRNALWSEGFSLDPNYMDGAWVEFFAGGSYDTLSFVMAPEEGYDSSTNATIEIYGDDDDLLYSSDELTYKSSPETVSIDISGQDYVKIYGSTTYRLVIGSPKTKIMFKNAQFQ